MWKKINLRTKIYAVLAALVVITLAGGAVMVWYTYRMERLLSYIIDQNLSAFEAAEALETALVNQKGFVSYYFIDGDPDWLRRLGEYRQIFRERLGRARSLALGVPQRESLTRIEGEYNAYIDAKDRVIERYKSGDRTAMADLHQETRDRFFKILDLCETHKAINLKLIMAAKAKTQLEARRLRLIAAVAMLGEFGLALVLAFVLVNHILGPVRRLTLEAGREGADTAPASENEIKALSQSVRGLIEDVDQTHSALEKSREHLLQAEKLALVGKLAAGMAHSIRNPFTSVKMRLFSLNRSLELTPTQREDFDVIADEIKHVDTIVQNFLEFSRPPKLKMQPVSPSAVVDLALQLLAHRLKSYDVNVQVVRSRPLPEVQADPEQLKEVLVNIVINACEAMEHGGTVVFHEEEAFAPPLNRVAVVRISDNGPGMPAVARQKIFQPFFTTKEDGTGLGLSIAARIIEEHGGWIDVVSEENQGATFIITLPVITKESAP